MPAPIAPRTSSSVAGRAYRYLHRGYFAVAIETIRVHRPGAGVRRSRSSMAALNSATSISLVDPSGRAAGALTGTSQPAPPDSGPAPATGICSPTDGLLPPAAAATTTGIPPRRHTRPAARKSLRANFIVYFPFTDIRSGSVAAASITLLVRANGSSHLSFRLCSRQLCCSGLNCWRTNSYRMVSRCITNSRDHPGRPSILTLECREVDVGRWKDPH